MVRHTRHLAAALGAQNDYFYDKSFKRSASSRRGAQRSARVLSKRARVARKRETLRIIDEQ